jgi:hypothetical protein
MTTAVAARAPAPAPEQQRSHARLVLRRCACGGSPGLDGECPACRARRLQRSILRAPVEVGPVDDPFEREAERVANMVSSGSRVDLPRRAPAGTSARLTGLGSGSSLPAGERSFMEGRFGHDFGSVRVHTGGRAAAAAESVEARAFTLGSDVVFGAGEYRPGSQSGRRLLAHELAHVVQDAAPARLRRTPARKVSCAPGPLNLPNGSSIADPVAEITAAEDRGNEFLDAAIDELRFAIDQINAGGEPGWPTISDSLGHAMQVMGLDPDRRATWTGRGIGTAGLLLRRLRAVRRTIGAGSFFFTCLGPRVRRGGECPGPSCDGNSEATSCAGTFLMDLCPPFWEELDLEARAATIVHESFHNFAEFIGDAGRQGNAECYVRFAQIAADVPEADQRPDLCPDP